MYISIISVSVFSLLISGEYAPGNRASKAQNTTNVVNKNITCKRLGWFGPHCQYKCRCARKVICDRNGQCPRGRCHKGWFGPACQYVDLAYSRSAVKELTDGNDTTCVPDKNQDSVTIELKHFYPFTWMRIKVSNPDFLHSLSVLFRKDSSLSCINPKNSSVDDTTLDIHCDLNERVKYVNLTGEGVQYLCSVYVSGGRNVALKQHTQQSSMYRVGGHFTSNKAVDGKTSSQFLNKSCSCTDVGRRSAHWNVTFSRPYNVNRYILYNRDSNQDRLTGFRLEAFNEKKMSVFSYNDTTASPQDVYTLISEGQTAPVKSVTISINNKENILTLCEVEVYGDSICEPGQYGRECEHKCNCARNEACFVSTGGCPSGCADGFQGFNCNETCDAGKYGAKCNFNCSQFCQLPPTGTQNSSCDHVDGACRYGCQEGYEGKHCTPVSGESGDLTAVVVGVLLAVILVAILVGLGFFFLRRRKRAQQGKLQEQPSEAFTGNKSFNGSNASLLEVGMNTPPVTRYEQPKSQAKTRNQKPGRNTDQDETAGVYYNTASSQSSTSVSLADLDKFMRSRGRSFFHDQFNTIPVNENATQTVGQSTENKHKNRYKNISAYDHSRVHLTINVSKKQGDYINASFVQGYKSDERFIASQGPTKIIVEDFVRMLWEQEVEKVVMLTNLVEDGKQKCERYWPEEGQMKVGEVTVELATTQVFANYTIRRLQLRTTGSKATQNVTHFHFTAWPDKDIPTAPWGLVDFEQRVASYPTSKPIVVHCSAGVGRTGTFIALRNVMRQAEETGTMDFFKTVQKLRNDRVNMVQTVDQYIFIHKAAQVAMLCIGTTVTMGDVQRRIQELQTKSATGQTLMEAEFKAVCLACDDKLEDADPGQNSDSTVYENSQNINKQKNRVGNILPKDAYRAVLTHEGKDMGDYINAVLVPSFTKQNQHILTQLPLPATTTDFWRLVTQYKVKLIVAFELDLKKSDKTISDYLPKDDNATSDFAHFKVSTQPVITAMYWRQQKLTVSVESDKMPKLSTTLYPDKEHHVTHLTCTTTDLDPGFLLAITEEIRSQRPSGDERILYTCRNGADYSGLACVLCLLLDRMDNDGCLTVPLVVGAVKAIRPQVVPNLEQYQMLYEVLQLYTENMSEYSNFGNVRS